MENDKLPSSLFYDALLECNLNISENEMACLLKRFGTYKGDINCKLLLKGLATSPPIDYSK